MKLEVDPARLKDLRTRLGVPLESAAEKAKVAPDELSRWETAREPLEIEVLRRLAKAYNRNWYVFLLLQDEVGDPVGDPAIPRDFRVLPGGQRRITTPTLIAFDDAGFLLQKIADLPRPSEQAKELPSIRGLDADTAAKKVRAAIGADLKEQFRHAAEYAALRYWSKLLAEAGIYVAQMSFPYKEVRAFCVVRDDVRLIVVSSQDFPRARLFSILHELGHLLLGSTAMCRPRPEDDQADAAEETFCNAFAAAMLMPGDSFASDPDALALRGRTLQPGAARSLAWKYGASELATARRLASVGFISQADYARIQELADDAFSSERSSNTGLRIRSQATRMINENSRLYAAQVLDAHARGDITFRDVGVLLDGNLKHVEKVRQDLAK